MRQLITLLILVVLAILLGTATHADSGYLLLSIYHWTIETTVWMGIFTVLAVILAEGAQLETYPIIPTIKIMLVVTLNFFMIINFIGYQNPMAQWM